MKLNRSMVAVLASASLLVLTSCGNSGDTTAEVEPTAPDATESAATEAAEPSAESESQAGGQVVEVGAYHLELVPEAEATGTHLDLYLQDGESHSPIPDAQVSAQIDLPDGTQQSLEMPYDAEGGHYAALLPSTAEGEYKVAVLSDISGEKVNGRFSFTK